MPVIMATGFKSIKIGVTTYYSDPMCLSVSNFQSPLSDWLLFHVNLITSVRCVLKPFWCGVLNVLIRVHTHSLHVLLF